MLLPALGKARDKARAIQCIGNMRQIGIYAAGYSGDWNNRFISGDNVSTQWSSFMINYNNISKKLMIFNCPVLQRSEYHGYFTYGASYYSEMSAFKGCIDLNQVVRTSRAFLVGDDLNGNASEYFLMYNQHDASLNNYGRPHLRHSNKASTLFVDGHAGGAGLSDYQMKNVLYRDTKEGNYNLDVRFQGVFLADKKPFSF